MARSLRGRGRNGNAEGAGGPRGHAGDDERQTLANSKARQDTIRMAVRELSRMEAERKAIGAEIAEFKARHIKGDLGFKLADWAAVYRIYNLETEDRDQLLDTIREGFEALGIGQSVDWVKAAENTAAAAANPIDRDGTPYRTGKADGLAGHRDHAARWPEGEIGAAAYEIGHGDGERERHAGEDAGDGLTVHDGGDGAEPPKRRRGRPRSQPEAGHGDLPPAA